MKHVLVLFLALVLSSVSVAACSDSAVLEPGMVNPGYHGKLGWFKESFLDIREDIAEAQS